MTTVTEHEAWVEYRRASIACTEAFLRYAQLRGDSSAVDLATRNLEMARSGLETAEEVLRVEREREVRR